MDAATKAASAHAPVVRLNAWQALMRREIGPLPLPVYLAIAGITIAAALNGKLPNDMIGGLSVLMLMGFRSYCFLSCSTT